MAKLRMKYTAQKSILDDHYDRLNPVEEVKALPVNKIRALDGIRGLAVIEVFLYHARTPAKNSGWIGVELFLALSGFVITKSLIGEFQQTGSISIWKFIKRRIARIYPALSFLLISYIFISSIFYQRSVSTILAEVVPSFFGVANWTRSIGLSFPKDLAHLWSVSVELQLYLLWGPVVFWLLRRSSKNLLSGILLIAAACFFYRCFLVSGGNSNSAIYNNTICRALPFILGSAAAAISTNEIVFRQLTKKLKIIGILIFVSALFYHCYELRYCSLAHWGRRNWNPLLVSASSAVIVWGIANKIIPYFNRLCEIPVLHYLGSISYGVFLWHYPLLLMFPNRANDHRLLAATILSILLGALSYELVEKRFLKRKS